MEQNQSKRMKPRETWGITGGGRAFQRGKRAGGDEGRDLQTFVHSSGSIMAVGGILMIVMIMPSIKSSFFATRT